MSRLIIIDINNKDMPFQLQKDLWNYISQMHPVQTTIDDFNGSDLKATQKHCVLKKLIMHANNILKIVDGYNSKLFTDHEVNTLLFSARVELRKIENNYFKEV